MKTNKAINPAKLCSLYNSNNYDYTGNIETFEYMKPYLEGDLLDLCNKLMNMFTNTQIGFGNEEYSLKDAISYYKGTWKLLSHFGLEFNSGNAMYNGKCIVFLSNEDEIKQDSNKDEDVDYGER